MKKITLILAATVLFAGISFAQQNPDPAKNAPANKANNTQKSDKKSGSASSSKETKKTDKKDASNKASK